MNDREKLIELMKYNSCISIYGVVDQDVDIVVNWEDIADHLIANGVVIQKQGEWDDNIIGFCNVCMECGAIVERGCIKNQSGKLHYCPNCGVKMKEVK